MSEENKKEPSVTLEIALQSGYCDDYGENDIRNLFNGKDSLTVSQIATLPIPDKDKVWALTRFHFLNKKEKSVRFAIFCADQCLSNFEKVYSDDERPREAVIAAKAWLLNPSDDVAESAAESAAWSARSAAESAAWSAAESAAESARSAAWSARSAAESAAWSAAWSARSAAESAAWRARSAAWSAARSAAWSAARSATWSAAWSAANKQLEHMLSKAAKADGAIAEGRAARRSA